MVDCKKIYRFIVPGLLLAMFVLGCDDSNDNDAREKEKSTIKITSQSPDQNVNNDGLVGDSGATNNNLQELPTSLPMERKVVDVPKEYRSEQEDIDQSRQDYQNAKTTQEKIDALIDLVQTDEDNALTVLEEAYQSPEVELRKEAIVQAQDFAEYKVGVDLLLKALDDPSTDIVMEAIEGLASVESPRVLEVLAEVAKFHPDPTIREVAQETLE